MNIYKRIIVILLSIVFILTLINTVTPVCSSRGLQPVQMECECLGWEFTHINLFSFGIPEGYDTQCIGISKSRTCTEEDKTVSCQLYQFGFGTIRRIKSR